VITKVFTYSKGIHKLIQSLFPCVRSRDSNPSNLNIIVYL